MKKGAQALMNLCASASKAVWTYGLPLSKNAFSLRERDG